MKVHVSKDIDGIPEEDTKGGLHMHIHHCTQMPNKIERKKKLGSVESKIITQIKEWEKYSFEYNWSDS